MTEDFAAYFVSELGSFVQRDLDHIYEQAKAPFRVRIRRGGQAPGAFTLQRGEGHTPASRRETRVYLDPSNGNLVIRHCNGVEDRFAIIEITGGYKIRDGKGTELYIDELARRVYKPIHEAGGVSA